MNRYSPEAILQKYDCSAESVSSFPPPPTLFPIPSNRFPWLLLLAFCPLSIPILPLSLFIPSISVFPPLTPVLLSFRVLSQVLNEEVLTAVQSQLVQKEIDLLNSLVQILETVNAVKEDTNGLKLSIEQLKDLFLLVIVGEFNSGKSSFLNAMLGKKWLEEGVTPTTSQVNILRNGEEFKVVQRSGLVQGLTLQDEHVEVHVPVPWLRQISLVDTPGTNAVVEGHQEITEHFVPRSDMVLFVTSCDRAFTESERTFLDRVRQYNKKVVVVLSKIDALEDPDKELPLILNFVSEQTKRLFGFVPQIFPVSSRMALRAKIAASKDTSLDTPAKREHALEQLADWKQSKFGPLESYILHTLNAKERGKLKLQNPLGIAAHYIKKYQDEQTQRALVIKEDLQTLERIDNEIEAFRAELMGEYTYHEERIDSVLYSLNERARNFLDENLVLTNAFNLARSEHLKEEFEKRVVSDAPAQIDAFINDMIDWILAKQAKQWSRVVEYAVHRQQISNLTNGYDAQNVMSSLKAQYSYNRGLMIANLGGGAKKVVDTFDKRKEADMIAATVKAAIFQTAAFEIGVVGLVCAYLKGLFQPLFATVASQSSNNTHNNAVTDVSSSISASSSLMPSTQSVLDALLAPIIQGSWLTFSLLDITGLLGVTAFAAVGVAWLPFRKRQLQAGLTSQINDIRLRLKTSLKAQFDHELQKGIIELKGNVAPYASLVQSEKTKLDSVEVKLRECSNSLAKLSREIDVAFA